MRKARLLIIPILLACMLISCAALQNVQDKWNLLTPEQKAQIVISDLQGQLDNAFTQSKVMVMAKPELVDKWKTQIVPAFDVANKALASVIAVGKTKPLTPEFVYAQAQALVTNALNFAIQIGAIK
jgi:hypothetical protein